MQPLIHRIAVLSDTHGLLRSGITNVIKNCEVILHGGDINSRKVLDELKTFAPLYVVRGNNDREWAEALPQELEITLFGLHIYMVHNKKHRKADLCGMDVFIYGHSHKYEEKMEEGILYLNPGSCGPRRFRQPVTMAVLEVNEETGAWRVERVDVAQESEQKAITGVTEKNIKDVVETIIREMRAGRKIDVIAARLGVDRAFTEQVCRIYVTHPGVDAQGIIDKMEVNALFGNSSAKQN